MKPGPTVFVVDDDPAVRDSLRCLLESANFTVEIFGAAQDFIDNYRPAGRACLLLDVRMPGIDGLELQRRLAERRIYLPIIILTAHADVPLTVRALRAGAVDLVEKPYDDEDLLRRVAAAVARNVQVDWDEAERAAIAARLATLSDREREILELLVSGKWVKQIAAELGTSPNTVRNQRSRILEKMEAESVAELVRMAMIASFGHASPQAPPGPA